MLDVTRFAKCLFAYLYRNYDKPSSHDLPGGLPTSLFMRIPSHFIRSLGDCIITINQLLRPALQTLFNKAFVHEICNEEIFLNFIIRLCDILPTDPVEILFLTMCAVVSELNLYFFHKNCYRFANYSPKCLSAVLKCSNRLLGTIVYDMDTFCVFRSDGLDGYRALVEYGDAILENIKADPHYVPEAVQEMSTTLLSIQVDPIEDIFVYFAPQASSFMNYAEAGPSTSRTYMSAGASTSRNVSAVASTSRNMSAGATSKCTLCRICRHSNCAKFLDDFENDFRLVY